MSGKLFTLLTLDVTLGWKYLVPSVNRTHKVWSTNLSLPNYCTSQTVQNIFFMIEYICR